jgi:hypothetical protein
MRHKSGPRRTASKKAIKDIRRGHQQGRQEKDPAAGRPIKHDRSPGPRTRAR